MDTVLARLKIWWQQQQPHSPREYAVLSVRFMNAVLVPVGINTGTDCRVTLYSYLCLFCVIQHTLFCCYTAFFYWDTNKISAIQPFTVVGVSGPVSSTIINLHVE